MTQPLYVTTAIPYVNGAPHIGHALELVQADVLARHARLRGRAVRFLTGTDDNALKNVRSAETAGVDVASFVGANADRFQALRGPLDLSNDDFIRTSTDPRHRPTVEWCWNACLAAGDLYRRDYDGWYCAGCERFYDAAELVDGACAEHGDVVEHVRERNWFFRLSRYAGVLLDAIERGALRIEPTHRRNEVIAFIRAGLRDFSVSRPVERSHGWGIAVPGDPTQVIYVWFDALLNYVSALRAPTGDDYSRWWRDGERVHVIGKGILRFHAVYWPAILCSAGQPLPTTVFVHDYLTVDGQKIGKSLANAVDPVALADEYGTDSLRWWLLRDVPRNGDADFTVERLVASANRDLANGVGNFARRVRGLTAATRLTPGVHDTRAACLDEAVANAPRAIDGALAAFDFRRALDALLAIVAEGNRYIEDTRPWGATDGHAPGREAVLRPLVTAVDVLARELAPFTPATAAQVATAEPVARRQLRSAS